MGSSEGSEKSRGITLALAVVAPCLGLHRFYVGKIGTGLLQLVTLGGAGIWWIYDLIMVSAGSFRDVDGKRVKYWAEEDTRARETALPDETVQEIMDELYALRNEMGELAERVDFAERLLTRGRDQELHQQNETTPV
jgi:hypothetical protein